MANLKDYILIFIILCLIAVNIYLIQKVEEGKQTEVELIRKEVLSNREKIKETGTKIDSLNTSFRILTRAVKEDVENNNNQLFEEYEEIDNTYVAPEHIEQFIAKYSN